MSNSKIARKERRIAARKRQIIQGAIKAFLEKGYNQATTKDIADAADVAEGTIYNYFKSKDVLLMETITAMASLDDRQKFFDESIDVDFQEFLIAYANRRDSDLGNRQDMLISLLPVLLENPAIRERYSKEIVQPATNMFEKHIQKRIELGQLNDVEDLPLMVRLLTATSLGSWLLILLGDPIMLEALQNPERLYRVSLTMLYDKFLPDEDK